MLDRDASDAYRLNSEKARFLFWAHALDVTDENIKGRSSTDKYQASLDDTRGTRLLRERSFYDH